MKNKGTREHRNVRPAEGALSVALKPLLRLNQRSPEITLQKLALQPEMPTAQPSSEPGCWPPLEPEPWVTKCPSHAIEISSQCPLCLLTATCRVLLASVGFRPRPSRAPPWSLAAELLPPCQAPLPRQSCFPEWHLDLGLAPVLFHGRLRSWQRRAEEQLGKPG